MGQTVLLKCRNDEQLRQWLNVIVGIKESTSKIDILPNTPQTPLTELNPLQDYYDDDEDDYYNHNTNHPEQQDDDHQPTDGSYPYLRNRSYSYQYNRMPHHLPHEHMARKQSLGNLSSSNNPPPRHFMNGIPGMTLPPLPRSPTHPSISNASTSSSSLSSSTTSTDMYVSHSLPYSPPASHPSSPNNHTPSGALWQRRQQQQQQQETKDEPMYIRSRTSSNTRPRNNSINSSVELLSISSNTSTTPSSKRNSNSNQEIPENYIKIKTHYNGSIYVVVVPLTIEFGELKKKIENKLRLCIQESAVSVSVLKYEDEDGDLVTMNSTDDVQMGFETKGPNNVVNFHVTAVC